MQLEDDIYDNTEYSERRTKIHLLIDPLTHSINTVYQMSLTLGYYYYICVLYVVFVSMSAHVLWHTYRSHRQRLGVGSRPT